MAQLFADLTALLLPRLDGPADRTLAPFAAEVFAIDETTLDPVARTLPALRGLPPGDDRLLPGKLAGLFDVRRQLWRESGPGPRPARTRRWPPATWPPPFPLRASSSSIWATSPSPGSTT